jgi:hypothetical protein
MHGTGQFKFSDGTQYVGEFENGVQHGYGMLTMKDGTEMMGKWNQGEYESLYENDSSDDLSQED